MANISYKDLWIKAEKNFLTDMQSVLGSIKKYTHQNEIKEEDLYATIKILKFYACNPYEPRINKKIEKKLIKIFDIAAHGFKLKKREKISILKAWYNFADTIKPVIDVQVEYIYSTLWKKYPEHLKNEVISSGYFGILKAIPNYDYRVATFSTYARKWIFGEVKKLLKETNENFDCDTIPDQLPGVHETLLKNESLNQALDILSPDERMVIDKSYFKDVPGKKIALQMERSEGRISQIKKESEKKIKKIINYN